jgi:hypothetical protein
MQGDQYGMGALVTLKHIYTQFQSWSMLDEFICVIMHQGYTCVHAGSCGSLILLVYSTSRHVHLYMCTNDYIYMYMYM